ncbi:hypothetical protein [Dictyobacter vulcani]|uniref:hypothetical protein n=1 Tax=Dictyobacter vulcani TaxID=2607529 RepID=UPI0013870ADE|nr:hypothetical protein [Dictyobacter vulcani]
MGQAIVGQAIVGQAIVGQAIVGQAIVGKPIVGKPIVGKPRTYTGRCIERPRLPGARIVLVAVQTGAQLLIQPLPCRVWATSVARARRRRCGSGLPAGSALARPCLLRVARSTAQFLAQRRPGIRMQLWCQGHEC